ncbi:MAG: hypothetical protein WBA28_09195 [Microbacteriaceae bacterium]
MILFFRLNGSLVVGALMLALLPFVLASGVFNGLSLIEVGLGIIFVLLAASEGRFADELDVELLE